MDKITLGFLADVLYIKGIICFEEFEAIQEVCKATDIDQIVENMLRGVYNGKRKGESYIGYRDSVQI